MLRGRGGRRKVNVMYVGVGRGNTNEHLLTALGESMLDTWAEGWCRYCDESMEITRVKTKQTNIVPCGQNRRIDSKLRGYDVFPEISRKKTLRD